MLVRDVIDLAKYRLKNVNISKDTESLIKVMYLGVSDLYNKFNLSVKSETIKVNTNLSLYTLRNKDVLMLLQLYKANGQELRQSDVIDSKDWDYKLVNYRSFVLHNLFNGPLYAVYKASPDMLECNENVVELPDAMINALLLYMAYIVNSTVSSFTALNNRNGVSEADNMYKMYINECNLLENQGYKIAVNTESLAITKKGFV